MRSSPDSSQVICANDSDQVESFFVPSGVDLSLCSTGNYQMIVEFGNVLTNI